VDKSVVVVFGAAVRGRKAVLQSSAGAPCGTERPASPQQVCQLWWDFVALQGLLLVLWISQLWWFLVRLFKGQGRCFGRPQALPVELKGPRPHVGPVGSGGSLVGRTVER
jgi:hypothetical protein